MKNKINFVIKFAIILMLVFNLFLFASAFDYNEDEEGNAFLESEFNVKAPSITLKDLLILEPGSEPLKPQKGMIYFDEESLRLKFYDGAGWYAIALEKISSVSKQQVKETIERENEVQNCEISTDCGEWGDCINNYQSMTCISIDENCNKYEDTETKDCISENSLKSSAKDSHTQEDLTSQEECHEECVLGEEVCEEVCEEEESCSESCSTDEEGNEQCEETCETTENCEEVCEPGEEVCEEVCEIPEELFDITFDLEKTSLGESDKLVVWITLQNFGKKYVPARLVYVITDDSEKEVYRKFEEVRVYTDESIIKKFDDLTLEEGEYTLFLKVEYAGIVEEFEDSFKVEKGIFKSIKRWFIELF